MSTGQGCHGLKSRFNREKSGNFSFSQDDLEKKYDKSQGKVREFENFPNIIDR